MRAVVKKLSIVQTKEKSEYTAQKGFFFTGNPGDRKKLPHWTKEHRPIKNLFFFFLNTAKTLPQSY